MKLLVTGSTGFIGTHLVNRLLKDGHEVHCILRPAHRDIIQKGTKTFVYNGKIEELIAYMKDREINGILHLASLFLAQHKSEQVSELINSNVLFGTSLLEAAAQSGVKWFINTGTFWQHYQNQPYAPVNLYSATKQAFEDVATYYREMFPINFVTLKLSDTFGPGDKRKKIFAIWLEHAKSKEPLEMSAGEQLIDISFIENVIDAYVALIDVAAKDSNRLLNGKSFAVKSAQRMSLKDLAELFQKVTGTKLNINWGAKPYRPREVMVPWENGETVPGWKPGISLEEGMRRTFNLTT